VPRVPGPRTSRPSVSSLRLPSAEFINIFIILNLIGKYLYLCNLIFRLKK
jgi:hypothetical protein